ncbi:MAG: 7-carboxy-7-deazaguanine synthase QueE [Peptococcaceae bacterium]|nr:MAG: 7-carboxy-7-deazaguanine synthase QueE [Peptococcaceae bacterium]
MGCRQVFIRFSGCNLNCAYCDTNVSFNSPFCRVEKEPGRKNYKVVQNPLSAQEVASLASAYGLFWHHSVALTGGEPLLYHLFIKEMVPLLKSTRRGIFLETNGILAEALREIIDLVDIIGMDFKLPGTTGLLPYWEEHRRFLEVARQKEVFVKAVVGEETENEEIETAAGLINEVSPCTTLVLQPVNLLNGVQGINPARVLELQKIALKKIRDVRIIPQTHKITGCL